MPQAWRKFENDNGFPYYQNEATNVQQWDHPKFADIMHQLDDCNYIKYAAYRVAAKFRVLQQSFYMDDVPLAIIVGVFDKHMLGATESSLILESYDLEAVLSDIYFAASKQNHTNIDIDFAVELVMNFLYNVYDKDRQQNIPVSSTKLVLAVLSKCKLSELYHFVFSLCADHNNCVTRLKLQNFLMKFTTMAGYLHEDVNFGHHLLNITINNCFSNSPGLAGIGENLFMGWLESGPQILAWIPTLHRMKAAEPAIHPTKCNVCKSSPLLGLRYRCVKCSNYTQCQYCFLSAKISNSHKLTHPMKEYCTEGNASDFTQMFIRKIFRLLRCSTMKLDAPRLSNNIYEAKVLCTSSRIADDFDNHSNTPGFIEPLSSPEMQLQLVIRQLELQNRELQQMAVLNKEDMKQYLEEHRLHVAAQIQKLKVLKDYLETARPTVVNATNPPKLRRLHSTPLLNNGKMVHRMASLDMLSPIGQITETNLENLTMPSFSIKDISTWIGGPPEFSNDDMSQCTSESTASSGVSTVHELHNDLDEVLAKLQQILANNFILDESLGSTDNQQLKTAVTETEGMLTSLIDSVEGTRTNSSLANKRSNV